MIYRVTKRSTDSLQPGGMSFWNSEVLYCGRDIGQARIPYHTAEPRCFSRGYGNSCEEVILEALNEDGLSDTDMGKFQSANPED